MTTKEHLSETLLLKKVIIDEITGLMSFLTIDRINDQFYRRLFLRDIFSIIETYLYILRELVKIKLVVDGSAGSVIDWKELVILNEQKVFLSDNGEIKVRDEFFNFKASLKFVLNTFSKEFKTTKPDFTNPEYSRLIELSKRRNSITHPKSTRDIIITDDEIKDAIAAFSWFVISQNAMDKEFLSWLKLRATKI